MRLLIGVFIILLCIFQYSIWFGQSSVSDVIRLKKSIAMQEKINKDLYEKNQRLLDNVRELKRGNEIIEKFARRELGMIKKGETYYQFVHD